MALHLEVKLLPSVPTGRYGDPSQKSTQSTGKKGGKTMAAQTQAGELHTNFLLLLPLLFACVLGSGIAWSRAWREGLTRPGCPQLHHGLRAADLILRHALVYAVILGPHADQPQRPAGEPEPVAGREGDGVAQPHDGGLGVPSHLAGELGALAPGNDLLGQLHGDLRGLCAGKKCGC